MRYYIISGEQSGDMHAANLVASLKKKDENADFRAWGGDRLKEEGVTLVKHIKDLAFMGFWEVIINLPTILKNISFCKKDILEFSPWKCNDIFLRTCFSFLLRQIIFCNKKEIITFYSFSTQRILHLFVQQNCLLSKTN